MARVSAHQALLQMRRANRHPSLVGSGVFTKGGNEFPEVSALPFDNIIDAISRR